MKNWVKKYWKDAVGVAIVVLLVMFVFKAFAAEDKFTSDEILKGTAKIDVAGEVKSFTGADGVASCISENTVLERFGILRSIQSQSNPIITKDTAVGEDEGTKHLVAAINTVLGEGTLKDGWHFQTIFMDTVSGKAAMLMIGIEDGQFCTYIMVKPEDVKKIGELESSTGA